ncbi:GlxA family transcriptional regulator [Pseudomonas syringae]|uniref:GlxA family transcriptional regulator n=1 Tax=Pseudomonas syringae TaxID=317 RepID=UPI0018E624FE|nr:helix-turn-helix domain-containing protein [Pseudomonas syringae]MBI6741357.1 helix-turn-helix domain-containing protein [Pseudomonas syringae]MBI6762593.1 helix-turn-helix domain-containing protein [Pseudomonas syringae]MBI6828944.1 helix-turn-helix domain-containing protein [Pseudomonas syringae]UOF21359.1 helix-turn-helix domain-containing protein [Pseudomonas syringae CC440]UZA78936.1 helix-turn-helix domain-containing protein [Pseudomonas syringae]
MTQKKPPVVALILYPDFSPFHFSVPYLVFSAKQPEGPLFDLQIVTSGAHTLRAERALTVHPDGGLELTETADILVVPGWHDLNALPGDDLVAVLLRAHARGAYVVGLCYGAYPLAYAGLLDGKRASTHWMAEQDFSQRFPRIKLDMNALYVEEDKLITSAGTGAGLDCCLHLVREYYGARVANKVARTMVIPPHREGGQAQFIEQPVAASTQDAQLNILLDYLRNNLDQTHSIDDLAKRIAMSRRTFTRHFSKATGMTLVDWLVNERLRLTRELLETTSLSIDRIAGTAGFQTPTSFRQHFKKRFQVSPSDWRKTFSAMK